MKRFHLFVGSMYYPLSGLGDYVGSYETLEEAVACAKDKMRPGRWVEVITNEEDGSLGECYTGL